MNCIKSYFEDYNYKKHAKLCLGVYGVLFAIDMTVSYVVIKKLLDSGKLEMK